MNTFQKFGLFSLRVSLGFLFLYAGITKIIDPAWSASGYLLGAKNFQGFYHALAGASLLPAVNFLNEWGLTLIGVVLILGLGVRLAAAFGIALMILYYGVLPFPYPNPHALLVDEHIIYIGAFLCLAVFSAGEAWGLYPWCARLPICAKYPMLRRLIG